MLVTKEKGKPKQGRIQRGFVKEGGGGGGGESKNESTIDRKFVSWIAVISP